MSPQQAGDRPQTTLALFQRNRSKADICTAIDHVRFTPECVAKLFAALRARNNRILVDGATNQRCAFSSDVESMFRQQPLKIVLQHIPPESGHCAAHPSLHLAIGL
jgi:hypothetical protein